ncbi:hypothetical protein ABIE78_000484 [Sinorhizobium fredii]|uniref:hypothetical protein n=1 Tax=Rhizobium fredii TaxID=380 RepID=UPI003519A9B5
MEPYAVDIDPEQIVRWITDEDHATPCKFRIAASRTSEHRAIPLDDARLGDEEREDLTEIATVCHARNRSGTGLRRLGLDRNRRG